MAPAQPLPKHSVYSTRRYGSPTTWAAESTSARLTHIFTCRACTANYIIHRRRSESVRCTRPSLKWGSQRARRFPLPVDAKKSSSRSERLIVCLFCLFCFLLTLDRLFNPVVPRSEKAVPSGALPSAQPSVTSHLSSFDLL